MNTPWTDEENEAIVADYFSMLMDDLAGRPYSKAEHNRQLQNIIGRSRASIEFKHRNISAVLQGLGQPWIDGYIPAANFQTSLIDAVIRWLINHQNWLALENLPRWRGRPSALHDQKPLWIGPPPTHSNAPPPAGLDQMLAVARKYDVAKRDAINRELGRAGEKLVLEHERANLLVSRRAHLSEQVRWVSDLDGDGAGYDIASFDPEDGSPRLIEVKTTNGWDRTPFYITRRELDVSLERQNEWRLVRVWNFAKEPKAFELQPPLERHVELIETEYRASFS